MKKVYIIIFFIIYLLAGFSVWADEAPPIPSELPRSETVSGLRRGLLISTAWTFLILFALGSVLIVRKSIHWWKAYVKAKQPVSLEPSFTLRILVRSSSGGEQDIYSFDRFPVTIGTQGEEDISLEQAGIGKKPAQFAIELRGDDAYFSSTQQLIVNGVAKREKKLKKGDRINFGRYRIYLGELIKTVPVTHEPLSLSFAWYIPGLALFLILFFVFHHEAYIYETTQAVMQVTRKPEAVTEKQAVENPAAGKGKQQEQAIEKRATGKQQEQAIEKRAPKVQAKLEKPENPVTKKAVTKNPAAKPDRSKTQVKPVIEKAEPKTETIEFKVTDPVVIGPGEKPRYFKADILCIHAHPDDESLDFGVLMSRASRSGKRIVTVIFTDGESGIDRYPERGTQKGYPDYTLKGASLARVRIEEAKGALSVLGSEQYIRLGLKNHPYNGVADILTLDQVLSAWGGTQRLVEKLAELIQGFKPDLIIAPDQPSSAYEHFEHEAVGYLVREAMEDLSRRGQETVQGYVVSVDPLQKDKYDELIWINATGIDQATHCSYRGIQSQALKEHITQADASVIGLERLPNFKREYYSEISWTLDKSLEEYLGANY